MGAPAFHSSARAHLYHWPVRAERVDALVERAAAGDRESFEALVDRFAGLVWSIARGFGLSNDDASDVSQTVWLRFVEHLNDFDGVEQAASWIAASTRGESQRVLRWSSRADAEITVDLRGGDDDGVWAALSALPGQCHLLLRVAAAEPRPSHAAVAAALEVPEASIDATVSRCLDRLGASLERIREAAASIDALPDVVVAAARASFTWRLVEDELAELVYDSALDDSAAVTVRGVATPRSLTFTAGGTTVDVECTDAAAGRRRFVGQLVPARAAVIDLRTPSGTVAASSDEHGRFRIDDVHAGPVSMRFEGVRTDWVTV